MKEAKKEYNTRERDENAYIYIKETSGMRPLEIYRRRWRIIS